MSDNMSSSATRSSDSERSGGLSRQHSMGSPEGNGRSAAASAQQNDHSRYQGTMGNLSEIQSSNSHVIEMGSLEGQGRSTASSAQLQQDPLVHDLRNTENLPAIRSFGSDVGIQVELAASAQVPQPFRRQDYRNMYLQLYKAAKEGKWKAAKKILDYNEVLVDADLTNRKETILHVATQANQADFVGLLLNYPNIDDIRGYLELPDANGNTAFHFAVASGNVKIVDIMAEKNENLLTKPGRLQDLTPLHIAALRGKSETAWYLYKRTVQHRYGDGGLASLLFLCVNAGIYDLALELLKENQDLAFKMNENQETVLHILSRKPLGLKQTQQQKLLRSLWNQICFEKDDDEIMRYIRSPSHVVFNTIEVGNFEFLVLLISTYPYLIWEVDGSNRSIIHIAVLNRQADIFSFLRDHLGSIKDIIVQYTDAGSNLLHMAAALPRRSKLSLLSGEAFQMTLELLWFEEVKKIVPPSFIDMKDNAYQKTPHELFTMEHEKLADKAQSWMKKTTNCCMVVSTLITTGVFTATFSIPGGTDDKTRSPNYLMDEKIWFTIFSIFDAMAMISSSTSLFIFFSILISRHAQYDFQYKSLPMKLIFGLLTLLISIISMMISFSSAFIMYFDTKTHSHGPYHNSLKWVPIFIFVLAFIPIPIFLYMLWPLWSDIAKLTKFSWHLSRPRRKMLHLRSE